MKLIFISFFTLLVFQLKAQKDTSLRKYSIAICGCLEKQNIDSVKNSRVMESVLLKCFTDSATELFSKIDILESNNGYESGLELGKKVGYDLLAMNCQAFIKMSIKMAEEENESKSEAKTLEKTMSGEIINIEEKEFISLTFISESGREHVIVYMQFVPDSDGWLKRPAQLRGKKVKVTWKEYEVYKIKLKDFGNFKELKELTFL